MDKKRVAKGNIENLPDIEAREEAEEMGQPQGTEAAAVTEPAQSTKPAESAELAGRDTMRVAIVEENGIISSNTKVAGDISTEGHLAIYGEVEGNISARGDIVATGKIEGDIVCNNLKMTGCQVKTNISVKEFVILDENARVEGRIQCRNISIDGNVRGDIDASGEVNIYKNARILGNIKTKALGIESGAEIQGNVEVVK